MRDEFNIIKRKLHPQQQGRTYTHISAKPQQNEGATTLCVYSTYNS